MKTKKIDFEVFDMAADLINDSGKVFDDLEALIAKWKNRNEHKHNTYLRECEKNQTYEESVGEAAMRFGRNVERNCIFELQTLYEDFKKASLEQPPLEPLSKPPA